MCQFLQQRLGFVQIRRIKPLSEPSINLRQHPPSFFLFALLLPQPQTVFSAPGMTLAPPAEAVQGPGSRFPETSSVVLRCAFTPRVLPNASGTRCRFPCRGDPCDRPVGRPQTAG